MSDRLDYMWREQRAFTEEVLRDRGLSLGEMDPRSLREWTRDVVLSIHGEAAELLEELDWRMHREPSRAVVRGNVVEEAVDVWKFLMNVLLTWGVSPEEFLEAFVDKSAVVADRRRSEEALRRLAESGQPVAAIDLDGVMAEYPGPWLRYLSASVGISLKDVEEARDAVDPAVYEDHKRAYRESGSNRRVDPIYLAPAAVEALRINGWGVVLLSSRPVKEVACVYGDTLHWLEEHGVPYDALIFDSEKGVRAARSIPGLRFVADDTFRHCREVARLGVRAYAIGHEGPVPPRLADRIFPVKSLFDAVQMEIPGVSL